MTQPTQPKQVIAYANENGKEPFTEWLDGLRDVVGRNASWHGWHGWNWVITETANLWAKA